MFLNLFHKKIILSALIAVIVVLAIPYASKAAKVCCRTQEMAPACYECTSTGDSNTCSTMSPAGQWVDMTDQGTDASAIQQSMNNNPGCVSSQAESGMCYECDRGNLMSQAAGLRGSCPDGFTYLTSEQRIQFAESCDNWQGPLNNPGAEGGASGSSSTRNNGAGGTVASPGQIPSLIDINNPHYRKGDYTLCDVLGVTINLTQILFALAGGLALVLFTYAGIRWITSGGNAETIDSARKVLVNTALGLVLMIAAWQMVHLLFMFLVSPPTGTDTATTAFSPYTTAAVKNPWYNPCQRQ